MPHGAPTRTNVQRARSDRFHRDLKAARQVLKSPDDNFKHNVDRAETLVGDFEFEQAVTQVGKDRRRRQKEIRRANLNPLKTAEEIGRDIEFREAQLEAGKENPTQSAAEHEFIRRNRGISRFSGSQTQTGRQRIETKNKIITNKNKLASLRTKFRPIVQERSRQFLRRRGVGASSVFSAPSATARVPAVATTGTTLIRTN
jgi:hypothetical protein